MLVLCVWLIGLIILLSLCVLQSPHMLLTPQFGFIGCFIPQAISLFFYLPMWNTDISVKTVILTLSGVTIFFVASLFFNKIFNGSKKYNLHFSAISPKEYNAQKEIVIEKWKLIVFLVIQLFVLFLTIQYYMENIPGATLIEKIAKFNSINKFAPDDVFIVLPKWISHIKHMCEVSSYIFSYILVHSIVLKYKQYKTLLFLNIVVSILNMGLSGGRAPMVCYIISIIIESYIIWGKSHSWEKKLKVKDFLKAIIIGCIILAIFPHLATLLGRTSTSSFINQMAEYVSGPYKNLDIYVSRGKFGSVFSEWQTFYGIIQSLGKNFGISQWIHKQDLPFQHVNGYNMGNVYTAFHAFLHDGGYPAFVFFLILEALLMQWFYKKAINMRSRYSINLNEIFYAFIYSKIIMSFFYDWFYSLTFTIATARMLIVWWILREYLIGIRFKKTVKVRKVSYRRATFGCWKA